LGPEEGASGLEALVQDERVPDASDALIREMESMLLKVAIEKLPDRTRYVLIRRYGLGDSKKATLRELAGELDISKERVRQLQREAEEKLKAGEHGRLLREAVA
jgi:RNA polymerase sigma factor (sigma-70 family)